MNENIFTITESDRNKDLEMLGSLSLGMGTLSLEDARKVCLGISAGFESKLTQPKYYAAEDYYGLKWVLDFAKSESGLKAHAAEQYIANLTTDTVGYAVPRVGHAAEAIAFLCERYNKRAVFFAPASAQVSEHQAVVQAYKGCELRFCRIAAMPTMNSYIRKWAAEFGATAIPFGLSGVKEVVAGLVRICDDHSMLYGQPTEFYCAVSTGTMVRGLQIGWPKAKAIGTAVARNIKDGEKGLASVKSYHRPFYKDSDFIPDFPTTNNYDAKAYNDFRENGKQGALFINVGSDQQIVDRLKTIDNWKDADSSPDWGDLSAFERE